MDRQLAMEESMVREGRNRARRQVTRAKEKGVAADVGGARLLLAECLPPVVEHLEAWRARLERGSVGRNPDAYRLLKDADLAVCGYLGLRSLVNVCASTWDVIESRTVKSERPLSTVLVMMGAQIEDELRLAPFEETHREEFERLQRYLTKTFVKAYHYKRRKMVEASKRHDVVWDEWTNEQRMHVGSTILTAILSTCEGTFVLAQAPGRRGPKTVVRFTERALQMIRRGDDLLGTPLYKPTLVTPRDWSSAAPGQGGYYRRKHPLVKVWNRAFQEELAGADIPVVLAAVNALQRTAWAVNTDVLEVAIHFFDNGGLPRALVGSMEQDELPPKPNAPREDKEAWSEWKRAARAVYFSNIEGRAKAITSAFAIGMAREFRQYDAFFFPYQLDFRGRAYPMPTHLTPIGSDLAKALLTFADAKPLGPSGVEALAVHVANCAGVDKVPFEERIAWVGANEKRIRQCAEDPISDRWWAIDEDGNVRDKAWRFLAAILEWAESCDYAGGQEAYPSRIPVAMDGSCNGLQHFGAMLRDEVGGAAVNLVPRERPADVYTDVLNVLVAKLQSMTDPPDASGTVAYTTDRIMAQAWLDSGFLVRKLVKRPVMTLPYGVTPNGMIKQMLADLVWPAIKTGGHPGFTGPDGAIKAWDAALWLGPVLWESIQEVVVAATRAMEWLQHTTSLLAKLDTPIYWTTPLGFPVRQDYVLETRKRVKTRLCGKVFMATLTDRTDQLDKRAQFRGIAPNFVHSMDATHMFATVYSAVSAGIDAFAMVHDSYATHAAHAAELGELLRRNFVGLYQNHDVLQQFHDRARERLAGHPKLLEQLRPVPAKGSLDVTGVVRSSYFFA